MTRRTLLKGLVLFGFVAASATLMSRFDWLRPAAAGLLKPRLDLLSPQGNLSEDEMENIIAFAEVLTKGGTFTEVEKGCIIEHVNYRTQGTPGYLSLYKSTERFLNGLSDARFSSLDLRSRAALVLDSRLNSHRVRAVEYLVPFNRRELSIRLHVVPDIIMGYYLSAAGWAVVGYDVFPGRCGNLTRYTRTEA